MSFLNNRSGIVSTKVNECPNIYSKPIFICDDLIFVLLRACLRENNANMEKKTVVASLKNEIFLS